MELIPVIDLMSGKAVKAERGDRARYRPLSTQLSPSPEPEAVLSAFLKLHPFRTVYIADLDAIERRGSNATALRRLRAAQPQVTFWVDCGLSGEAECRAWFSQNGDHLVLGSESQSDLTTLNALTARAEADRLLLSLDFRGAQLLGPPALLEKPTAWPDRIICMTLERVGSGSGVDFARLADLKRRAPQRSFYAAGGVKGEDDLARLQTAGAAGVLLASALHDGALTAEAIRRHSRWP
jgi:phosphoribosylformimino-5-aminoimidazole carboxamide ribotide isomerase